jgi:putative membrane protein
MSDLNNYNSSGEMILRDYLALDRTKLANERTFLAYMRTAIGLIASAIGLIEIVEVDWAHALGYVFLVLSPICLFFGFFNFLRMKAKIGKLDKKP